MHEYSIDRDNAVAEAVRDIVRIVREESVPLPVLNKVHEILSEYDTPTKYQLVMSHLGINTEG